MIAAAAFIIGFALIGLTVVLVAFRGGPRGAREGLHTQTPRGRQAVATLIVGCALIFGVGIPAAVLADNGDDDEVTRGAVQLTAGQTEGRHLFAKNCGMCHTLNAAQSSGRVGPNLDQLRPPEKLVLDAIDKGRARGQGQMPAELLVGKEAEDVASFVAAVAGH
jgi:mono/diheme cytochrome c family protein